MFMDLVNKSSSKYIYECAIIDINILYNIIYIFYAKYKSKFYSYRIS